MTSPLEIALRLQAVKINLTWGRKWDFIRIIFAVARYMPFVDVPVDLIYTLGPTSPQLKLYASAYRSTKSPHDVHVMGKKQSVTCFPTATRTGKIMPIIGNIYLNQDILQGCIAGCGVVGASASSLFRFQRGYHVDQDPPLGTSGCYQTQRIAIYAINYALLALFETGEQISSLDLG
ncbi:hypothetical protein F4604DRAFT_1673718 [Suillus subluteus]|nr:hypothetical protein F4604DRAFT_1673718 [Suillus subluteus]